MTAGRDKDSVTVPVRQLRPVTSPLELKAITVREYTEKARRAGAEPNATAIERFAEEELRLVDAFKREARPRLPRAPRARPDRADPVTAAERATGVRRVTERRRREKSITAIGPQSISEKWAAATARIARLLENGGTLRIADIDRAIANTTAPKLAREFLELWWHYQLRHRQSRFNPFAGLNEGDAARLFMRRVFDICDRSTGIPGLNHWWVK